jgi:hypothetical protein
MNKITLNNLKTMAQQAKGNINKIYLHWSAGHYGQFFDDYHINIDSDGSVYVSTNDLTEHKNHTYMRNTGGIGIGLACCAGATTNDLSDEPPTNEQVEAMAQVIAVLCASLEITPDINSVLTHAEAANNLDGENPGYEANGCPNGIYGPNPNPDGSAGGDFERWDLWILKIGDASWSGGNTLRGKAIWYQQNGVGV